MHVQLFLSEMKSFNEDEFIVSGWFMLFLYAGE